ncbi:hypothetical protein C8Q80DRAFT_137401 [Daedaleopsis nitida]|nr:hypothetical protein C8Q80DRAFT_137401 [Daedaleopsis nitida]
MAVPVIFARTLLAELQSVSSPLTLPLPFFRPRMWPTCTSFLCFSCPTTSYSKCYRKTSPPRDPSRQYLFPSFGMTGQCLKVVRITGLLLTL